MLNYYKTWIFDCDGVILDSNHVKSEAFYEISLPFGEDHARQLREYNQKHGGVSRDDKIKYFVLERLKEDKRLVPELLKQFGDICAEKLMNCCETPGLRELLLDLPGDTLKYVASGGLQEEVRFILDYKSLFFDGVFGSPATKYNIIDRLKSEWVEPVVFIGDSALDYKAAVYAECDFVFMSQFSEFEGWKEFFKDKECKIIENLLDLISV